MCGQQWCVTGISVLVTEKSTEFAPSVLFSVELWRSLELSWDRGGCQCGDLSPVSLNSPMLPRKSFSHCWIWINLQWSKEDLYWGWQPSDPDREGAESRGRSLRSGAHRLHPTAGRFHRGCPKQWSKQAAPLKTTAHSQVLLTLMR